ncbi:hypothetical protein KAALPHA_42 [Klebsiella phage vB_KaeM_KaAlpha]|uniref:Uncharacterized protein n=1 Tax=Klebsiella phage vB_KaeM_KaAlpha TaxID=2591367 RepID=A0A5B9NHA7_9CAUD|nr:hypothetical protein KAALPHA_42 [Klebsiella phage vB_KaeM_KaAlpha]
MMKNQFGKLNSRKQLKSKEYTTDSVGGHCNACCYTPCQNDSPHCNPL